MRVAPAVRANTRPAAWQMSSSLRDVTTDLLTSSMSWQTYHNINHQPTTRHTTSKVCLLSQCQLWFLKLFQNFSIWLLFTRPYLHLSHNLFVNNNSLHQHTNWLLFTSHSHYWWGLQRLQCCRLILFRDHLVCCESLVFLHCLHLLCFILWKITRMKHKEILNNQTLFIFITNVTFT